MREGEAYDANVTSALFDLNDKKKHLECWR